jgi:hypothetical protein
VTLCQPKQHFTLRAISAKNLACGFTVVFVRSTLLQQKNFQAIAITLHPLVLAAVMYPTYHPTHALYIYLVSRAVRMNPVMFYVFSMPGELRETTRIVCKK